MIKLRPQDYFNYMSVLSIASQIIHRFHQGKNFKIFVFKTLKNCYNTKCTVTLINFNRLLIISKNNQLI